MCNSISIKCGNELNLELKKIVGDCTRTLAIKSDHRIIKTHVTRELILAVRERDRLFDLHRLYPDNMFLEQMLPQNGEPCYAD